MTGVSPAHAKQSLVLHIGPRKTATTSVQGAFASMRQPLRELGVVYPGEGKQHFQPINRFIGRRQMWETDLQVDVVERPWRQALREIGDAPYGVISTEVLSQARREHVQRIVDSAPERTPVVVITYRLFEDLLSSTWQQLVKEGLRDPLDEWSRTAAVAHPERSQDPFPRILDLATLVDLWGGVVGTENVVVILIDPSQPQAVFNAFEEVLSIPQGFLVPEGDAAQKRSFTAEEAELLRQTNSLLPRDRDSLTRHRALRRSLASWLDQHPPSVDDSRISLPPDVVKLARERSEEMVRSMRELSGQLRVFGDLDSLLTSRPTANTDWRVPTTTTTSVAAQWLAMTMQPLPEDV
ncbi:MAG: hypothetical protein ACJ72Y_03845 [Actinomycetes bacterium]